MKTFRWLVVLFLAFGQLAEGQMYHGQTLVVPSLISDTTAVEGGKPFRVGVLLKHAPDWHTYWKFPGDSGLSTTIDWTLPPGFQAGPLQWPAPVVDNEEGDLQVYVYKGETLLFATITPPKQVSGPVEIVAKANWLVCEKLCVPGKAELHLNLAIGPATASPERAIFEQYAAQIPSTGPPPSPVQWSTDAQGLTLQVANWTASATDSFFFPNPPEGVLIGHPAASVVDGRLEVKIPFSDGSARSDKLPGVLKAGNQSWEIGETVDAVEPTASSTSSAVAQAAPTTSSGGSATLTLLPALLFGFIGGLILNLMPCVLPVISLKMFSFVKQAGESRQKVFRLGLAFAAGMFAWFLGIGVILLIVRSTGAEVSWAQQFQNPWFNMGISVLIFLFALNLLGVYQITLPGAAANRLTDTGDGLPGAFFQGMFATILGTPCTAPYLGTTLAFALTQPPLALLSVFAAIAFGMSAPYLLLCANPGWMRFLPKPGAWMERLKEFMGFLLLATLLWFIWIVGRQMGINAVVFLGTLLLLGGLAAWVYGTYLTPIASDSMKRFGSICLVLIIAVIAVTAVWFRPVKEVREVKSFAAELDAALATDRIVFVDFTADWCLSCKVNKRVAIDQKTVQAEFQKRNVLFLEADWTNGDPEITKVLKKYGRAGVPLYLVYPSNRSLPPILLPEVLTPQIVLDALAKG